MNWELTWNDSFKNHRILRLKSGCTYVLEMCIVLNADYLALSIHTNEVIRLNLKNRTWNAKEDWNQTAKMLDQRYQEIIGNSKIH